MAALLRQVSVREPGLVWSKRLLMSHCKFRSTNHLALKRLLSVCIVLLGLSLGLSKVVAQRPMNPIALVPQTAVAVAKINWTVVSRDPRFRAMLNADQLDRGLAPLKIGGSDVSEIVIFSGINSSPSGVLAGVFRGSFNLQAVNSALKSQSFAEQKYKGHTVYFNQADRSCATICGPGRWLLDRKRGLKE